MKQFLFFAFISLFSVHAQATQSGIVSFVYPVAEVYGEESGDFCVNTSQAYTIVFNPYTLASSALWGLSQSVNIPSNAEAGAKYDRNYLTTNYHSYVVPNWAEIVAKGGVFTYAVDEAETTDTDENGEPDQSWATYRIAVDFTNAKLIADANLRDRLVKLAAYSILRTIKMNDGYYDVIRYELRFQNSPVPLVVGDTSEGGYHVDMSQYFQPTRWELGKFEAQLLGAGLLRAPSLCN